MIRVLGAIFLIFIASLIPDISGISISQKTTSGINSLFFIVFNTSLGMLNVSIVASGSNLFNKRLAVLSCNSSSSTTKNIMSMLL